MLQLYDLNKAKIRGLKKYKDLCVESVLATGDKTLSFLYPARLCKEVVEEGYIRTKTDEFVIKEIQDSGEYKSIKAILNVEELEGKTIESFEAVEVTIGESIRLALAGTGWTLGECNVTKRRTIRKTNSSSFEIIEEAKKVYRVEFKFDTINKTIDIFEKLGSDKGVYFKDTLNLVSLNIQSNSYDFYTRIKAIGKTIKDSSGNDVQLKVIVENFQHSKKVKELIWKDERYSDIHSLREDAEAKLNEFSKPYRSYAANVIDLSRTNIEYKDILNYELGDTITLVSSEKGIREKQRIVKLTEYPDEPGRNKCEIANTTLNFEDIQKEFQDTTNVVNNITSDDGTISEDAIKNTVKKLTIDKINVNELNAVKATIGELDVNKLNSDEAYIKFAEIDTAIIGKAEIIDLEAATGKIDVLETKTANIETLVNGNLTSDNIHSLNLTTDKVTVQDGFIKNAMIDDLSASKIKSGSIDTNEVTISSKDGSIKIADNTQQFKDKNGKVRMQLGEDYQGDFSFLLLDETGQGTLIDHTGIKEKAIADGLIKENMIGDGEIGGKKIDISSMLTEVNKDNNSTTIKASKIKLDTSNQTLEIGFNSMNTKVEDIKVEGRNYVLGTATPIVVGGENRDNQTGRIGKCNGDFLKGKKVVVTASWEATVGSTGTFRFQTGNNHYATMSNYIDVSVGSGKIEFLTTPYESETKTFTTLDFRADNLVGTLTIRNVQIELGTKPSMWKVAPEDIDKDFSDLKETTKTHSTTINTQQGEIKTAIENTTIVKDGKKVLLKDDYSRTVQKVDGLSTTVGTHTSEISGLDKKVTTANSEISQLKNKIALKVEATEVNNIVNTVVTDKISDIQIGGRNYVLTSGNFKVGDVSKWKVNDKTHWGISVHAGYTRLTKKTDIVGQWVHIPLAKAVIQGKTYAVSFMIRTSKDCTFNMYNSEINATKDSVVIKSDIKTKANAWQKVTFTFTASSDQYNTLMLTSTQFKVVNETVDFEFIQVEEGTKATDWTPAPEDVNSSIADVSKELDVFENTVNTTFKDGLVSEAEAKAIAQNINILDSEKADIDKEFSSIYSNTRLSGTTKTNLNTSKTEYDSSHTSLKSFINTAIADGKATSSEVASVNSAFGTYRGKLGTYKQRVQEALDFISTAKVNNVKTGGDNLLYNTGNFKKTQYWLMSTSQFGTISPTVSSTGGNNLESYQFFDCANKDFTAWQYIANTSLSGRFKFNTTKQYTLSGWVHTDLSTSIQVQFIDANGVNGSVAPSSFPLTPKYWTYFEYTFTPKAEGNTNYLYMVLNNPSKNKFRFKHFKLEEGNKATTWSPSLDELTGVVHDVDVKVEAVKKESAQVVVDLKSITSRVEKTETTTTTVEQITKGTRCHSLGAKIDYSSFSTTNEGEIYLHGFDSQNKPSDTDGYVNWSGVKLTIPKGMLNPNSSFGLLTDVYIYKNTESTNVSGAYYDVTTKKWKYIVLIGTASSGDLNFSDGVTRVAFGQFSMATSEKFKYATLYQEPKLLSVAISQYEQLNQHESRITSAEQKITDTAIVNTVKNHQTSGKSTFAQTAIVEQLVDKVNFNFSQSGGNNCIKNGNFKGAWSQWSNWGSPTKAIGDWNKSGAESDTALQLIVNGTNQGVQQYITGLSPNTKYTFRTRIYVASGKPCVMFDNNGQLVTWHWTGELNKWHTVSFEYTPTATTSTLYIGRDGGGSNGTYYFTNMSLTLGSAKDKDGNIIAPQYQPHPSEVYEGSTTIDADGIVVYNGAFKIKNKAGETILEGDDKGNLKLNVFDSKFTMASTGHRKTEYWNDVNDLHNVCVPYYNKQSGYRLWGDTDITFISTYAGNGYMWLYNPRSATMQIDEDLTVCGTTSSVYNTRNYGTRKLYSIEDSQPYCMDTCTTLFDVDENKERIILIDNVVKQCINTEIDYIVDIHKVGWGDYRIKEQTRDYFIVESDSYDFTFKYTIKGTRQGFENVRLQETLLTELEI